MKKQRERGAIVMEATIGLTAFMFMLFILLMIVENYYIQARIGVALSESAKDLSQYSFLYFKLGLSEIDAEMSSGTDESRNKIKGTVDAFATLQSSISGAKSSASNLDYDGFTTNLNNGIGAAGDVMGSELVSDPGSFLSGMATMALDEGLEEGKSMMAAAMAKAFMEKNLTTGSSDDANSFLRRYKVVDGMDGLDFNYTTYLPGGTSSYIQLVVSYDVQVVKLLGLDFKFHFRQAACTCAWALGVSKIHPETNVSTESASVWDYASEYLRQQYVINQERKEYDYIATGQGFDAYDNSEEKNEFIKITALDVGQKDSDDAMEAEDITKYLEDAYDSMKSKVEDLDKTIVVQDKKGKDHELESDPDTRTYRVILVIPEGADEETVKQAVEDFKSEHSGVEVEVRSNLGGHASEESGDDSGGDSGGGFGLGDSVG